MPKRKTDAGEGDQGVGEEHEAAKNAPSEDSGAKPNTFVPDPWSEEQETCLLKGIIRWKPVGMHKHFRMVAIWNYMKSQGYASPTEPHTRIPNIWKKLSTLYNLEGLDEREEPVFAEGSEASDEDQEYYCPFELPEDEYGSSMFERRFALDGTSSPPLSALGPASSRGGTFNDTDEAPSPAHSSRTRNRSARQSRSGSSRKTRSTRGQTDSNDDDDDDGDDDDSNDDNNNDNESDDNESGSNNDHDESSEPSDTYEDEPSYHSQSTRSSTRGQATSRTRARRSRVTKRGR